MGQPLKNLALSLAFVIAGFASAPAHAGSLTRTFVSAAGDDSNPCTLSAPCRTFAGAYAATAANGIISALDPAGYGALSIGGPITIDGNGWAAITAPSGGIGISIGAGPGDKVILTGLSIDGAGTGIIGIAYSSGASLTIENCVVRNVGIVGLQFTSGTTTPQTLAVSNSDFNNTGNTGVAITAISSGAMTASFKRTEFNNNNTVGLEVNGVIGTGAINVAVTDSVVANNGLGVQVQSVSGQSVVNATLTHSQVVGNGLGFAATGANATLWLAQSTVTGNTNGYGANGGVINTYDDNYFADNGSSGGTLTPANKQ